MSFLSLASSWGASWPLTLAGLFAVALVAGCIDAIAGGGGLLCLPALLAAGLSPAQALATNKLQGSFGTCSASLHFIRAGQVDPRALRPVLLMVFLGAAAGTVTVQRLDPSFLAGLIPLLLAAVAAYVLFSPRIGDEDSRQRLSMAGFAATLAPLIGFYDGFFGPGTGSFFAIALVGLLGINLRKATAQTKLLNLTSNLASLLFFLAGGKMVWSAGLAMAAGQVLGARLGVRLVITRGARLVRPCLVAVSLLMTAKLLLGGQAAWLERLWRGLGL